MALGDSGVYTSQSSNNPESLVKTTCPYCGVGCGVVAQVTEESVVVQGDVDHPANFGRLCSKGSALGETLGNEGRLLTPFINGVKASWDQATSVIADKFSDVIKTHGPDAVAFYVSGQILTEDYYVANKLMKGFIGSGNIDTNSRLCMASSVAGHKRAFGADVVPGCYEDLELADLIVLTGSNLAWCHPVLYQRILAAKEARPEMKIVVIDPRKTATCDFADFHLALAPGSDVFLFQGLLSYLAKHGATNNDFVSSCTDGLEGALHAADVLDLTRLCALTGLNETALTGFFELFLDREKSVTVYSQGVNQAQDGTDRVNAIINCHLLTGRIGRPGMGPFSVTGQPNAMGGREVGGLANQLACHMELERPDHRELVQRFWQSPCMAQKPGLKAVDMFDAVHRGDIKAIWIMATNPVASLPNASHVREALEKCELVIVSDVIANTDTARCADILLPSTGWGEKDGTVTNSERRISRQRKFLPELAQTRDDWRQFCDVATKMGWGRAFDFEGPDAVFREYASLCAFQNEGSRDLDLTGLQKISAEDYNALRPVQWPVPEGMDKGTARMFEDGKYFTSNGRAQFIVPGLVPVTQTTEKYPLLLNTGRIRDQWHTMTRTGRSARLSQHFSEPFVEISPDDAMRYGLKDSHLATISSDYGEMNARVRVSAYQENGSIFAPMHWSEAFAKKSSPGSVIAPITDPISGQPATKSTAVRIQPLNVRWFGFGILASNEFSSFTASVDLEYWAKAKIHGGVRLEFAGGDNQRTGRDIAEVFFSECNIFLQDDQHLLEYSDAKRGIYRLAKFDDQKLLGAVFLSASPIDISRSWAGELLTRSFSDHERYSVLAGRPGADVIDRGAIICSCLNVGANEISDAVSKGCMSVKDIGAATGAGTNCGSCRSEIRQFLREGADA